MNTSNFVENVTSQSDMYLNVSTSISANNVTTEASTKTFICGSYDLIMNALVKLILLGFWMHWNSLSIMVMWSERSTSATAFLLIVLAVVDTLLMLLGSFL